MFNKLWVVLKGVITFYFIVTFLSPVEQGVWYTFINLGALSIFAELGFTVIITQFISHEYANLRLRNGYVYGKKKQVDKLFDLIRYSIRLYYIVVPVAVIIFVIIGYFYFVNDYKYAFIAWVFFSIVSATNLIVSLFQAIYQGLDKVVDIQKNIFIGSLIMPIFNWLMLAFGVGIWALIIGNAIGVIVMAFLLFYRFRKFWYQFIKNKYKAQHKWFKEIIVLQWKYAVSWVSGYFIFFLYVPSVFKTEGAVAAGQLGLTLTVVTAITGISASIIDSKIPRFNILVSTKKFNELIILFKKSFYQRYLIQIVGSVFALGLVIFINRYDSFNGRLVSPYYFLLILLYQLAVVKITSMATFLRSHKEEPYYVLSIVNALLISIAILWVLPQFGFEALLIATNVIYWAIILPVATYIFSKRKEKNEIKLAEILY